MKRCKFGEQCASPFGALMPEHTDYFRPYSKEQPDGSLRPECRWCENQYKAERREQPGYAKAQSRYYAEWYAEKKTDPNWKQRRRKKRSGATDSD